MDIREEIAEQHRVNRAGVAEDRRLAEGIREHLTALRRRYHHHPENYSMPKKITKLRQAFDDLVAVIEEREMSIAKYGDL